LKHGFNGLRDYTDFYQPRNPVIRIIRASHLTLLLTEFIITPIFKFNEVYFQI
jgi:hypothetical protein